MKDYRKVLELEPNNKVAKLESEKIQRKLENEEQFSSEEIRPKESDPALAKSIDSTSPKSFGDNIKQAFSSQRSKHSPMETKDGKNLENIRSALKLGQVLPVEKKPHLRSKKPLRRIPITQVESKESYIVENQTKNKAQASEFLIRKSSEPVRYKKSTEEQRLATAEGKAILDNEANTENSEHKKVEFKSALSPKKKGHRLKIQEIISTEDTQSTVTTFDENPFLNQNEEKPILSISKSKGYVKMIEDELIVPRDKTASTNITYSESCPPTSSVSFYSSWRNLTNAQDSEKLKLLNTMRSKDYPIVFKYSLEPSVFEQILQLLCRCSKEDDTNHEIIAGHVYGLSRVPRVSAMVMFLNSADNASLQQLVNLVVEKSKKLKQKQKESIQNLFL